MSDPNFDVPSEEFARNILLNQLAARPRSRGELAEALAKKHVPPELAATLLDRFEEVGLIDDAAFAQSWVESRHRTKGLAPKALAIELRRKGLTDAIIDEATAPIGPEQERLAAQELVRKRLTSMSQLDDTTKIRRLTGLLGRKGYAAQLAFDVVREELSAPEFS